MMTVSRRFLKFNIGLFTFLHSKLQIQNIGDSIAKSHIFEQNEFIQLIFLRSIPWWNMINPNITGTPFFLLLALLLLLWSYWTYFIIDNHSKIFGDVCSKRGSFVFFLNCLQKFIKQILFLRVLLVDCSLNVIGIFRSFARDLEFVKGQIRKLRKFLYCNLVRLQEIRLRLLRLIH